MRTAWPAMKIMKREMWQRGHKEQRSLEGTCDHLPPCLSLLEHEAVSLQVGSWSAPESVSVTTHD